MIISTGENTLTTLQSVSSSLSTVYVPTLYNSAVLESGSVIKTSSGVLYRVYGYNSGSATQYIQLHNDAAQPANMEIPVLSIKAAANDNFSFDCGKYGMPFSAGIVIANSLHPDDLESGSADCMFQVTYD